MSSFVFNVDENKKKTTYIIYRPFDFACSQKQLTYMYGPIVGQESIFFYQWLINEYNIQNELKGIASPIERIFQSLNLDANKFAEIREKLEALDLIVTYLEQTIDRNIFHIKIKLPLTWITFNENPKFKQLLINAIGISEYERISLAFIDKRIPKNVLNISATFKTIYGNKNIDKISYFNFDNLYETLNSELGEIIIIPDSAKMVIDTFYKTYDLSILEIKRCVFKSIKKNKNDSFKSVNTDILRQNLFELVNISSNVTTYKIIKINRNPELFCGELDEKQQNLIFTDYININSELYLSSIQKDTLSDKQKETIDHLRNVCHLTDDIINVLTDFMIYRTNGKYNSNYIKKLAQNINCLGLSTIESVLKHLRIACGIITNTSQPKNLFSTLIISEQNSINESISSSNNISINESKYKKSDDQVDDLDWMIS